MEYGTWNMEYETDPRELFDCFYQCEAKKNYFAQVDLLSEKELEEVKYTQDKAVVSLLK